MMAKVAHMLVAEICMSMHTHAHLYSLPMVMDGR